LAQETSDIADGTINQLELQRGSYLCFFNSFFFLSCLLLTIRRARASAARRGGDARRPEHCGQEDESDQIRMGQPRQYHLVEGTIFFGIIVYLDQFFRFYFGIGLVFVLVFVIGFCLGFGFGIGFGIGFGFWVLG
jgi:hypothetical protein